MTDKDFRADVAHLGHVSKQVKTTYSLPDAACQDHADPDMFFEEKTPAWAKRMCNGDGITDACPEKLACLKYALTNKIRDGVWGGLDEGERARLLKRKPIGATA